MIDRCELMDLAWHVARQDLWSHRLPASELRSLFPDGLRTAWREMKRRGELAAGRAAKPKRPADEIRAEFLALENIERLGFEGIQRLSAARSELNEVLAGERKAAEEADLAEKRDLIASAKGRFCAVTFTKRDGSERTMRVQPAALKLHLKGEAASAAAQKAAATRGARHPNLLPVWDADARAPRSVNLATVSRIVVDGRAHQYATPSRRRRSCRTTMSRRPTPVC